MKTETAPSTNTTSHWASVAILVGAALPGCNRDSMVDAQKDKVDAAVQHIKDDGLRIREVKINGPKLVVVFTDIHNGELQEELYVAVDTVQRHLPLQLMGLEGFPKGVISNIPDAEFKKQIETIVAKNPEKEVPEAEVKALGMQQDGERAVIDVPNKLAHDSRFVSIGLETSSFPEIDRSLVIFCRDRFTEIQHQTNRRGITLLGVESRLFRYYNTLDNAQHYLASRYPDFKTFDFGDVVSVSPQDDPKKYPAVLKGHDDKKLADINASIDRFEQDHLVGPRSTASVEYLNTQMTERNVGVAGMVIGLAHTIDMGRDKKSVQYHLDAANVSYIVAEPVPVKIETKSEGVFITLPYTAQQLIEKRQRTRAATSRQS